MLTPPEATELFGILRTLVQDGMSVIFISHKLNEVLEIADRITTVRRGKKVDTVPREGATEEALARMMVGREVLLRVERPPASPGDPLLEVEGLEVLDDRGLPAVKDVSFQVRAGEIVGIAGVDGNGQSELIEAITGLRRARAGKVKVSGPRARPRQPAGDAGRGRGPRPRGSPAARARARVPDRGERRAARLQQGARLEVGLALPAASRRARAAADQGVRRARRGAADARRSPFRRQPAEARRRRASSIATPRS